MGIENLSFEDIKAPEDFCEKVLGLKWEKGTKGWPPRAVSSNQGTLISYLRSFKKTTVELSYEKLPAGRDIVNYEIYCQYVYVYLQWLSNKKFRDDAQYLPYFRTALKLFLDNALDSLHEASRRFSETERAALNTFITALKRWLEASSRPAPSAPPKQKPGSKPPAPKKPTEPPRATEAPRKPPRSKSPSNTTVDVRYRLNRENIQTQQVPATWTLGQFVQYIQSNFIPRDATGVRFFAPGLGTTENTKIKDLPNNVVVEIEYQLPKDTRKPKNSAPSRQRATYRYKVDPSEEIYLWTDQKEKGSTVSDFLNYIYDTNSNIKKYGSGSDRGACNGADVLIAFAAGRKVDLSKHPTMRALNNSEPFVIKLKMLTFYYSLEGDNKQVGLRTISVPANATVLKLKNDIVVDLNQNQIRCKASGVRLYIDGKTGSVLYDSRPVCTLVEDNKPYNLKATVHGYPPHPADPARGSGSKNSYEVKYYLMEKTGEITKHPRNMKIKDRGTFRDLKEAICDRNPGYTTESLRIYDSPNKNKEMNDDAVVADQKCKLYYIMIDDPTTSKDPHVSVNLPKEDGTEKPNKRKKAERPELQPKEQPKEKAERREKKTHKNIAASKPREKAPSDTSIDLYYYIIYLDDELITERSQTLTTSSGSEMDVGLLVRGARSYSNELTNLKYYEVDFDGNELGFDGEVYPNSEKNPYTIKFYTTTTDRKKDRNQKTEGTYKYFYQTNRDGEEVHTIDLDERTTVQNFKMKIADDYEVENLADIKIIFAGKDLLNNIVLKDLNIGNAMLYVYIRTTEDILLMTAKALQLPRNSDESEDSDSSE